MRRYKFRNFFETTIFQEFNTKRHALRKLTVHLCFMRQSSKWKHIHCSSLSNCALNFIMKKFFMRWIYGEISIKCEFYCGLEIGSTTKMRCCNFNEPWERCDVILFPKYFEWMRQNVIMSWLTKCCHCNKTEF